MADAAERGLSLLFGTLLFTGLAAVATWRTFSILRQEFNATHRPKLKAHKFQWVSDMTQKVNAHFVVVNTGVTDAQIRECRAEIFRGFYVPPLREINVNKTALESGEYVEIKVISTDITDLMAIVDSQREARGFSSDSIRCVGIVRYKDKNGAIRETGFDRLLDVNRRVWTPTDGSDMNYSY